VEKSILMGVIVVFWCLLLINRDVLSVLVKEKDVDQLLKMTTNIPSKKFQDKRLLQSLSVVLLIVLSIYLQWQLLYVLVWVVVAIILYKLPYIQLKSNFKRKVKQLKYEFPIWLRQLQILLQNNTVVVSLQHSQKFAPEIIRNHLAEFTNKLKSDPQNLRTYIEFLEEYECVEVERAMKLLYRYNTVGKQDSMKQLNRMISSTSKWLREQRLDRQDGQSQMKQWWGMLPLFGVTIVFITMMMQTFTTLLERG